MAEVDVVQMHGVDWYNDAEALEQPNPNADDNHDVEKAFDRSVHGYVGVDEHEQKADENQCNHDAQ